MDGLGQSPAVGYRGEALIANMSSSDNNMFIKLPQILQLDVENRSSFSNITQFVEPGIYHLVINFSQPSLHPIQLTVVVRDCIIGEYMRLNGLVCQECSAVSYNFHPRDTSDCQPCPENANCATNIIQPNRGYWHRFPCSHHIQRCLSREACDYDNREEALDARSKDIQDCSTFNSTIIDAYEKDMCTPGYEDMLCGACEEGYGRSRSFNCAKCFACGTNVALVILATLIVVALSGFGIRSNLVSLTVLIQKIEESRRSVIELPAYSQTELRIQETIENGHHVADSTVDSVLAMNQSAIGLNQEMTAKIELEKWKGVEMFKIAINFMQITAIAILININWDRSLVVMFGTAEFLGGVTAEVTNRSIDCLVSTNSSVPRSILRTLIDLSIPVAVIVFYVVFWVIVARRKKEDASYFIKRCILSASAVSYISYVSVTKTLVDILECVDVQVSTIIDEDHMTKRWAMDTSLECYKGSHAMLAGLVGLPFLFIFSFGFPCTIALVTYMKVDRTEYKNGSVYDTLGFLYRSYRSRFVFWESVVMLRKALLAVVVVFAYPLGGDLQAGLAVTVLLLALYFHTICRPFREEFSFLNEMEGLSLLFSLLTFLSGQFFNSDLLSHGVHVSMLVAVCLANSFLMILFTLVFLNIGAQYLRTVLIIKGIHYNSAGGTWHILKVYCSAHVKCIFQRVFRGQPCEIAGGPAHRFIAVSYADHS